MYYNSSLLSIFHNATLHMATEEHFSHISFRGSLAGSIPEAAFIKVSQCTCEEVPRGAPVRINAMPLSLADSTYLQTLPSR